jgi:hypothetical protein
MLLVDVGIVVVTAILVFSIASAIGKPPGEPAPDFPYGNPNYLPPNKLPPSDPNNPYQSPFSP